MRVQYREFVGHVNQDSIDFDDGRDIPTEPDYGALTDVDAQIRAWLDPGEGIGQILHMTRTAVLLPTVGDRGGTLVETVGVLYLSDE